MEKDDYNMNMENDYVKQVIVIRKDLKMRKGKIAAQAAHAAMKVLLDRMKVQEYAKESTVWEGCMVWHMTVFESEPMHMWLKGQFTKIVVYVENEKELFDLKEKAEDAGLLTALITDAGRTEFHGKRTNTCIAIGPAWHSELEPITGDLPLL
jgi:PTH2 family peptidyl-tRNA hydrolase